MSRLATVVCPIWTPTLIRINHKVLNNKPNETGINNSNCHNKDTCPLPNSYQTKCMIYQANIDCDNAGYKQKCYFNACETTFKGCFTWVHEFQM